MNNINHLTEDLQKLHDLLNVSNKGRSNKVTSPQSKRKALLIRNRIPQDVLNHFDHMRLRGKKPIASVRHAVCSACHLQIPQNHFLQMHQSCELDVCDNCGTFIFLED
jgi:predicted  nucleic acid-binding Zn-ribbon protein